MYVYMKNLNVANECIQKWDKFVVPTKELRKFKQSTALDL